MSWLGYERVKGVWQISHIEQWCFMKHAQRVWKISHIEQLCFMKHSQRGMEESACMCSDMLVWMPVWMYGGSGDLKWESTSS
jgi:hypothetical protein